MSKCRGRLEGMPLSRRLGPARSEVAHPAGLLGPDYRMTLRRGRALLACLRGRFPWAMEFLTRPSGSADVPPVHGWTLQTHSYDVPPGANVRRDPAPDEADPAPPYHTGMLDRALRHPDHRRQAVARGPDAAEDAGALDALLGEGPSQQGQAA